MDFQKGYLALPLGRSNHLVTQFGEVWERQETLASVEEVWAVEELEGKVAIQQIRSLGKAEGMKRLKQLRLEVVLGLEDSLDDGWDVDSGEDPDS